MIKHITPSPASAAEGTLSDLYRQIRRDFGFIGDIFLMHSVSPSLLAAVWASLRESELAGSVPRKYKEAVAAAVAKSNQCAFCEDAHATMLMAAGNSAVARKLLAGQIDDIADEKMKRIVSWGLSTRKPGSPVLSAPPFRPEEMPEMIGTVVINHYITRMVDVLMTDKAILPVRSSLLGGVARKMLALLFAPSIRKSRRTGDSLQFLDHHPLPNDMGWARSNPVISRAFASLAAAAEAAGAAAAGPAVRGVVKKYINEWDGQPPGISRMWADRAVEKLGTPEETIAAKLALLAAIAPYQIDDDLVREFSAGHPKDEQLLHLLSWASFTASRKIGTWL